MALLLSAVAESDDCGRDAKGGPARRAAARRDGQAGGLRGRLCRRVQGGGRRQGRAGQDCLSDRAYGILLIGAGPLLDQEAVLRDLSRSVGHVRVRHSALAVEAGQAWVDGIPVLLAGCGRPYREGVPDRRDAAGADA